jgi:hypothetical protein
MEYTCHFAETPLSEEGEGAWGWRWSVRRLDIFTHRKLSLPRNDAHSFVTLAEQQVYKTEHAEVIWICLNWELLINSWIRITRAKWITCLCMHPLFSSYLHGAESVLSKQIVAQMVTKFSAHYGITLLIRAGQWFPSWARLIQFTLSHPISLAHWLRLALPNGPIWVGVFPSSPEDGNRSSFRNVVFL